MKQKKIIYFLFASLFLLAPSYVNAATEVGGNFFDDQHWVATSSPYIIKNGVPNGTFDGVGMAGGATLTIDPGVVVKFEAGTQLSSGSGIIKANGTSDNPIIFTALTDDTAGGDTNGDGASTTPAVAYWNRIVSGNDDDEFEYVQIRYATRGINGSFNSPDIKNSIIENCTYGIDFNRPGSETVIENNTIKNNLWGIYITNFSAGLKISSNNIYDNTNNGAFEPDAGGAELVDVSGNWWGDASGPFNATLNPTGTGNSITDNFILNDFLSSEIITTPEVSSTPVPVSSGGTSVGPSSIPPAIINFSANPSKYKEGDGPVRISWKTEAVDFVYINGELRSTTGTLDVIPDEPTTYKLRALGPAGEVSKELFVDFAPRDPVVIVPGILGSWGGKLDPIFRTYEGLINGLESVGYIEGETLFRFPYDWRRDNRITAQYLSEKVEEILETCDCSKVDVVAHSMGGLVTRYYVQNINSETVDQVIFLGTPQLGAPKAYLAWEAGKMGNDISDLVMEYIFRKEAKKFGFGNVVQYIQSEVHAVKQLLPIYSYLYDVKGFKLWNYDLCKSGQFPCNDFLEQLNKTDFEKISGIRVYSLLSDQLRAMRAFSLDTSASRDDFWKHGKPVNFPSDEGIIYGAGDGTVPIRSAEFGVSDRSKINAEHRYLPHLAQPDVTEILVDRRLSTNFGPPPYRKFLIFKIGSPVDLRVTGPSGDSYGEGQPEDENAFYSGTEDPEFITIPDPSGGNYQIEIIGTGSGEFEVEVALLGDDLEVSKGFKGTIVPEESYQFSFNYSSETEEVSELEVIDTTAPVTEVIIEGENVGADQYVLEANISFSVKDESKIEKTLYSFDSGQTWNDYIDEMSISSIGNYQVLYRSVDEYGNGEYANIRDFAIVERPTEVVELSTEETSDTIEDEIGNATTTTSTGEVLGVNIETESNRFNRKLIIIIVSILVPILIIIYLRKQRV